MDGELRQFQEGYDGRGELDPCGRRGLPAAQSNEAEHEWLATR